MSYMCINHGVRSPLTSGGISFKTTKIFCWSQNIFAVSLLKEEEINDLKTAKIKSILVLFSSVLQKMCSLRASGNILLDFILIKLQARKFN